MSFDIHLMYSERNAEDFVFMEVCAGAQDRRVESQRSARTS